MVVDISNSVPMDLAHDADSAMIDLTGSPLDIGQKLFIAELLPEPGSFTVDESLFNPWKLG